MTNLAMQPFPETSKIIPFPHFEPMLLMAAFFE
jgi:hypothetical protein